MFEGRYCVIRTYASGVHVGVVREVAGRCVILEDARRIWNWEADNKIPRTNTLNEISLRGVSDNSNISEPVAEIALLDAIEVIPCLPMAADNLKRSRWNK